MRDKYKNIVMVLFILFASWWFLANFILYGEHKELFADSYWILSLIAGIFGLIVAKKWGGFKSIFGKAITFFALGLLAQTFGQVTSSYYARILEVEIPYPSVGDIGYFGSTLLYILAAFFLSRAIGVRVTLRRIGARLLAVALPIALLVGTYFVFLNGYEYDFSHPLTVFLDFGYPLGHALYLSFALLALLLSHNVLGGVMQRKILFVLVALFTQYAADFTFLYRYSRGTYVAGGLTDFIYLMSYLLMALALLQLGRAYNEIKEASFKVEAKAQNG